MIDLRGKEKKNCARRREGAKSLPAAAGKERFDFFASLRLCEQKQELARSRKNANIPPIWAKNKTSQPEGLGCQAYYLLQNISKSDQKRIEIQIYFLFFGHLAIGIGEVIHKANDVLPNRLIGNIRVEHQAIFTD